MALGNAKERVQNEIDQEKLNIMKQIDTMKNLNKALNT